MQSREQNTRYMHQSRLLNGLTPGLNFQNLRISEPERKDILFIKVRLLPKIKHIPINSK